MRRGAERYVGLCNAAGHRVDVDGIATCPMPDCGQGMKVDGSGYRCFGCGATRGTTSEDIEAVLLELAPDFNILMTPAVSGAPFPLLTPADLAKLPEPTWLVDGLVPAGAFTVLYGPSGQGKSFLALDWSLCIANGLPWYGHETRAGRVVFILAEGVSGLSRRVRAWETARGHTAGEAIHFLPAAVNFLHRDEVERARETIAALPEPPVLIVVDTMARTMIGGDENAARDVGQFIANVDSLAAGFGAARLVVHHTGKNGDDERGSSALRGAADAMYSLKPDGSALRLECSKMKDSEPAEPWTLHLETVAESCVLRPGTDPGRVSPAEAKILEAVSASFGTDPTSASNIIDVSGVPRSSVFRALKRLDERSLLVKDGTRYRLTEAGQREVVPLSPNGSHEPPAKVSSHSPPLGTVGLKTPDGWQEATPEEEQELDRLASKELLA